ncbi:MAG: fumarylacetoacetate hydrolase family protein [Oceanicaulis sp.]
MTSYVIAQPPETALPVESGGYFPVRRIYCVGRNYADHAREMGSDPDREPPFFFSKPRDAVFSGETLAYPPATQDLHHEVELVLALGGGGADLSPEAARSLVYGCAVGVDLTRRDLQAAAKASGRPWDMAKGFDGSAPVGALRPRPAMDSGAIELAVNGQTRQTGDLSRMIWSTAEIISHLSTLVRLEAGDLIFTGTPAGVGALERGDRVEARIDGLMPLSFVLA